MRNPFLFVYALGLATSTVTSAAPFDAVRLLYSGSGGTPPEKRPFNCKVNKTLFIGDFLSLPDREKVLLTRDGRNAFRFSGPYEAYLEDGEGRKPVNHLALGSCAVVGNGGVLQLAFYGSSIDSHDVVFRTNQAPTLSYERHTGVRTTFRVVNKHWLIKYSTGGPTWLPKERGMTLVMGRGEEPLIKKTFDYYTNNQDIHTAKIGGQVGSRSRALLQEFRKRAKCIGGSNMVGGTTPTSGLYQVIMALSLCRTVTVYGFGDGGRGKYQYYRFFNTERAVGNTIVHSFEAEKALVKQLAREGRLTFCQKGTNDSRQCGCQHPSGSCPRYPSKFPTKQAEIDELVAVRPRIGRGTSLGIPMSAGPVKRAGAAKTKMDIALDSTVKQLFPASKTRQRVSTSFLREITEILGQDSPEAKSLLASFQ
eukprot:CAMPEP_0117674886 /NCGR_PEP_ID=MMETSP0804-20121206/15299_1 /TAXON_ID=1074897 /ORGANISM="Tetraselmis astigmatica, Strain CCMP880" /LENGTH=421 /DNA_ID=CAMNT_0005483829 /DNA_START=718 /DNA_END=1983 /DNA_ORIENTATION=+